MFKKIILLSFLFSNISFALPVPTDEAIRTLLTNPDFHLLLKENAGFKSVNVNVLWGSEITKSVVKLCSQASNSRSKTVIKVELNMLTYPHHSIRTFYFATSGSPEALTLCQN